MFMGSELDTTESLDNSEAVIGVLVDNSSLIVMAMMLPIKKMTPYVMESVVTFIDNLGYDSVIFRSDNENACQTLGMKVEALRTKSTRIQHRPRYSSPSKGTVEAMTRRLQGQIRTMCQELERVYQTDHGDTCSISWGSAACTILVQSLSR